MERHYFYLFLCLQFISKADTFVPFILPPPAKHPKTFLSGQEQEIQNGQMDNGERFNLKPAFIGGRPINPRSTTSISVTGTCRCPPGCLWPCTLQNGLCWSSQCGNTRYNFLAKSNSHDNHNIPVNNPIRRRRDSQEEDLNPRKGNSKSFLTYSSNKLGTFPSSREFYQKGLFDREQGEAIDYNENDNFDYNQDEDHDYDQNDKPDYNNVPMDDELIEYVYD